MSHEADDAALMARIAAGDVAAMRALYDSHADATRRFVLTRLRDRAEAADIVHETMLAVRRGAAGFEGRASLRARIFALARNKVVDHLRRRARVTLAEPDETTPDEAIDPESTIAAAQNARRLRACVDALPDRQRAAVHLAFYEDLSYREIAVVEQVTEGTVKTRIFHARRLLMRCLSRARAGF